MSMPVPESPVAESLIAQSPISESSISESSIAESVGGRVPKEDPPQEGPLKYAPKRTRRPEQDQNPVGASPKAEAAPQRDSKQGDSKPGASELLDPPWKRPKQLPAFAGDVARAELRNRLALAPERLPDPPKPVSSIVQKYGSAGRLLGIFVVATVGVVGYRWGSALPSSLSQRQVASSPNQGDLPSARSVMTAFLENPSADAKASTDAKAAGGAPVAVRSASPLSTSRSSASPKAVTSESGEPKSHDPKSHDRASARAGGRELTVDAVRLRQADEPAGLAISSRDAGADGFVVIAGLAPGSTLPAGMQAGPNMWRLSAEEFKDAAITPPRGFVGTMDLTLELRLADNTVVDRKGLQLEWSAKTAVAPPQPAPPRPPPRRLDAAEVALIMKSGADLMVNGDIAAARMMFRRAAEGGEAVAAVALAETYDPLVLKRLKAKGGITPDVALAHSWYEKAKDLGSAVAPERLERLARLAE